eukprot:TRINITY_DN13859_c0_g1_i2.p1 TRINITY_DN13859_c0_g1~~TRINITY_DN13859_c0_g1_i2.p1  ORF type:complete len:649 (+),score=86.87 TRINITY_DN13859_c0_g1_i2:70-2016(+)
MILYSGGEWALSFIFQRHGSVFHKGFAWAIPTGIAAAGLQLYFQYTESGPYQPDAEIDSDHKDWREVLSCYSSALSFLLVFRTQIAYTRLWEGVSYLQLIQGSWLNVVSSCVAFCSPDVHLRKDVEQFKHHLVRLVSLMYCSALTSVCDIEEVYEVMDFDGIDRNSLIWLGSQMDQPEIILQWIQRLIVDNHETGVIRVAPPILARAFQELGTGIINLNNARRIKLVPFPFPYAQMMSVLLVLHMVATVVVAGSTMRSPPAAFCQSFMTALVFWSINYVAMEIEMPYGEDANDLPLNELAHGMNSALASLLQPQAQIPPVFQFDPDQHRVCKSRMWKASTFQGHETDVLKPCIAHLPSSYTSIVYGGSGRSVTRGTLCRSPTPVTGGSSASCGRRRATTRSTHASWPLQQAAAGPMIRVAVGRPDEGKFSESDAASAGLRSERPESLRLDAVESQGLGGASSRIETSTRGTDGFSLAPVSSLPLRASAGHQAESTSRETSLRHALQDMQTFGQDDAPRNVSKEALGHSEESDAASSTEGTRFPRRPPSGSSSWLCHQCGGMRHGSSHWHSCSDCGTVASEGPRKLGVCRPGERDVAHFIKAEDERAQRSARGGISDPMHAAAQSTESEEPRSPSSPSPGFQDGMRLLL